MRKCNLNQAPCHETCESCSATTFQLRSVRQPPFFRSSMLPLRLFNFPCPTAALSCNTPCHHHLFLFTSPSTFFLFPYPFFALRSCSLFLPPNLRVQARKNSGSPSRCSLFAEVARVTRVHSHTHTRQNEIARAMSPPLPQ